MTTISGNLSDDARLLVLDESDWTMESNVEKTAGAFSVSGLNSNKKLVIARKTDGEAISFGNITAVAE